MINYNEISPIRHSLNNYSVCCLFLQGKEEEVDLVYETGRKDYSEGALICAAPVQIGEKEDNGELINMSGWAVLFHPDILQGTGLGK